MSYQDLASEWHGGQFTALYSYASTGVIVDIDRLITEVYEAIGVSEESPDAKRDENTVASLYAFRDWLLQERDKRE
jgi:hypothetical protein|tara:strand:- start:498 stop:725 length:228 start_codon:yes stop_codon:yes gene_type:complete